MAGKRSRQDHVCFLGYEPGTPLVAKPATTPECEPHEPWPEAYIASSEYADLLMKTHDQRQCRGCGLWLIWTPKGSDRDMSTAEAEPRSCQDCGAEPGTPHGEGCDTARCVVTGMQRLACAGWHVTEDLSLLGQPLGVQQQHADCGHDIWTGQWPGEADAIRLGWWCYFVPYGNPSWVQCGPDHPEARPDLNRLAIDGKWNRELQRWESR